MALCSPEVKEQDEGCALSFTAPVCHPVHRPRLPPHLPFTTLFTAPCSPELKEQDEGRAQSFEEKKNMAQATGSVLQQESRSQSLEDDLQKKHLGHVAKSRSTPHTACISHAGGRVVGMRYSVTRALF